MESLESILGTLETRCNELQKEINKKEEEIDVSVLIDYYVGRMGVGEQRLPELNLPDAYIKIAQHLTYIWVEPRRKPELIPELGPYACMIDISHGMKKKSGKPHKPPEELPLDLANGILGEDLSLYVGKKIPVIAYRYRSDVIEVSPREESSPLAHPKKCVLERAGMMHRAAELLNKLRERYTSQLKAGQERLDALERLSPHKSRVDLESELSNLRSDFNYVGGTLGLNQSNPVTSVKGKILRLPHEQFYAGYVLCLGEEPVIQWIEGNWYNMVFSKNKLKPMKFLSIKKDLELERIAKATGIQVKAGDYFALDLDYRIFNSQKIEEISSKVREGIEIFPSPSKPLGIRVVERTGTTPRREPPKPRHWGQEYAGELATGEITEGEFFATGFSYQAFPVGNLMVVEANEEGRATYVFDGEKFDSLRFTPRAQIMLTKPSGYKGRVVHGINHDNWKKDLQRIIEVK